MLRFESVFWAVKNKNEVKAKLEAMGFDVGPSLRDPAASSVFFGPESIELFGFEDKLSTLTDQGGLSEFVANGGGIYGVGIESNDIVSDYKRLQEKGALEKPRRAKDAANDVPLWFGFTVPTALTPGLKAWVVMNSPFVLNAQARDALPKAHANTCFGIEEIALASTNPQNDAAGWAALMERPHSGLKWPELEQTAGRRVQSGERFLDIIEPKGKIPQSGVFMLTLRVTDLEECKRICQKAGAETLPCYSRDGFIVPPSFTGGPALRFVRSYWKRYLPMINDNYPMGRRTDSFRPLGGAYTSTLEEGFADNWNY